MWQFLKSSQRFKEEITSWVSEGIIDTTQAEALAQKYELHAPPPWYKRTSFVLQGIALLLAAMGFFLLIAMNWESLPIPIRTSIGLAPLLVTYIFAIFQYRKGKENNAELLMAFASLLFGANIALQAQIYHISAYFPDGLLWWILGTMPVIFFFRSTLLALIFQVLFVIWLNMQMEYTQFSFWGIILFGAFGFFLYKNPNPLHLVFAFVSGFIFILHSLIFIQKLLHQYEEYTVSYILFSPIYAVLFLALLQFIKHQYSETVIIRFQNLIATTILFMLYLLTFGDITKGLMEELSAHKLPVILLILYFSALLLGIWKRHQFDFHFWLNLGIAGLFISATFFDKNLDTFYTIIFNILLLAILVHKIYLGIQTHNKSRFMWGVGYLVLLAISRYVHLVNGDFLLTGIIFIACSLGIFALNRFWNNKFGEK
jgi:uncharacterized membrane protein